jgi:hypothetical protein
MIYLVKKLLKTPTMVELIANEMEEASRSQLEAETALDYAASMVQYHSERIGRLKRRLIEYKELT